MLSITRLSKKKKQQKNIISVHQQRFKFLVHIVSFSVRQMNFGIKFIVKITKSINNYI